MVNYDLVNLRISNFITAIGGIAMGLDMPYLFSGLNEGDLKKVIPYGIGFGFGVICTSIGRAKFSEECSKLEKRLNQYENKETKNKYHK